MSSQEEGAEDWVPAEMLDTLEEYEAHLTAGGDANPEAWPVDPSLECEQLRLLLRALYEALAAGDETPIHDTWSSNDFDAEYEILESVGQGGMGEVFKVRQRSCERIVALKTLRKESFERNLTSQKDRFWQEAKAISKLEHEHIVRLYSVGEYHGAPFFTMPFFENGTLEKLVEQSGPLESRKAAELLIQIAGAIRYTHDQGILHRDIKPANILVRTPQHVCVSDFGLATTITDRDHSGGSGTWNYMAPEQLKGEATTVRTDVYGLGGVLYFMLTGRAPRAIASMADVPLESIRPIPAAREHRPTASPDLSAICARCIHLDPAQRYANADYVIDDLRLFCEGRVVSARRVHVLERLRRWRRRNPLVAALVMAVALLIAVVAGGVVWTSVLMARESRDRLRIVCQSIAHGHPASFNDHLAYLSRANQKESNFIREYLEREALSDDPRISINSLAALTRLGDSRWGEIVDQIEQSQTIDLEQIVSALTVLSTSQPKHADILGRLVDKKRNTDGNAAGAIAAASLLIGADDAWLRFVRPHDDPSVRVELIKLSNLMVSPRYIGRFVQATQRVEDAHGQAVLALIIGRAENRNLNNPRGRELLKWLRKRSADNSAGLHSAVAWAMREHGLHADSAERSSPNVGLSSREWFDVGNGITMLRIPAGDLPQKGVQEDAAFRLARTRRHRVNAFYLSSTEITVKQFEEFVVRRREALKSAGFLPDAVKVEEGVLWTWPHGKIRVGDDGKVSLQSQEDGSVPAGVSWYASILFCNWLSSQADRKPYYGFHHKSLDVETDPSADGFRLPTDEQWEYACRAGAATRYCSGNDFGELREYATLTYGAPGPVDRAMPNAFGLFDMHGNVCEWVWDYCLPKDADPDAAPRHRVVRGGWAQMPAVERASSEVTWGHDLPKFNDRNIGLRVACPTWRLKNRPPSIGGVR